MEIHAVHLADSASDTGTIEISHEIDVIALVEGELEGTVMRVT